MLDVTELADGVTCVRLSDRIDYAAAQKIEAPMRAVAEASAGLVIDLSLVSFMASMGLRTLISCAKVMNSKGGKAVLLAPQAVVARVITVSGVDKIVPVFTTETEAWAAARPR